MKLFIKKAGNQVWDEWIFSTDESGFVSDEDAVSAVMQCLNARRWTGTKYMMVEKPK